MQLTVFNLLLRLVEVVWA